MSERKDLTRWNRSGLSRFQYIDGNAIEYLETLRKELVHRFMDPKTGQCKWLNPAVETPANEEATDNETLIRRQERLGIRRQRLLEMYHQDRRDWSWEIARTFARACHILTGHMDAYANEMYLGTATQWDNVRRLVEMLDYHPAPPASASTRLVLGAKESKTGLVKKGWQVKYKPPEGDKVVFETLDDVQVHYELNGMRLEGFNKSPDGNGTVTEGKAIWSWGTKEGDGIGELELSAGSVAVLENLDSDDAIVVIIDDIDNSENKITLSDVSDTEAAWEKGETRLLVEPDDIRKFRLNGSGVVRFNDAHGLDEGDVIAWQDNGSDWYYNRVIESHGALVRLFVASSLPENSTSIFRMYRIDRQGGSQIKFPLAFEKAVTWDGATNSYRPLVEGDDYVGTAAEGSEENTHNQITNAAINEIYLLYSSGQEVSVGIVQEKEPAKYIIDGSPGDLASGQWIVAENEGGHLPLKIRSITEYEDHFAITFEETVDSTTGADQAERAVRSLKKEIRKLQVALDESAMRQIRLSELMNGSVAERDAICIQNVGTKSLAETGISSVKSLAELSGIAPTDTRLNELKTKASMVLEFRCDAQRLQPLSGKSLAKLLKEPVAELAGQIVSNAPRSSEATDVGALIRLYGPFGYTLYPKGHDRNETEVGRVDSLTLDGNISADALALLKRGRPLVLEREGRSGDPVSIEVSKVEGHELLLSRKLKEDEAFTKGSLVVRGNVVLAGHGEGKPAKILGSGNAVLSNQSFILEIEGVAFPADATKPSGVAAALDVEVEGRIWEQVSTLKDSAPSDHHYAIHMTEEGYVKIIFGDGEHGRRLPTGKNNARVRYREGSGLAGNVPAGGLEKPVNPHPLIDTVQQPLPAAGGGDMEDAVSLRTNAPPTLLALERAVSLSDFSHLAAGQSSVWQAKAYSNATYAGRTEQVNVVIVPAGGGVMSDDVNSSITDFLQKHALPGVRVKVEDFNGVAAFEVVVTVRVKTGEFIPEEVEKEVESALKDYFALKNRKLGVHLYLSEIYKIVEGVHGVENSKCVINLPVKDGANNNGNNDCNYDDNNDKKALQLIRACDEKTVVYLDTEAGSTLSVTYEEYQP